MYNSEESFRVILNANRTLSLMSLNAIVGTTSASVPTRTPIEIMCCSKRANADSRFELKALGETITDLTSASPSNILTQKLGQSSGDGSSFIDEFESNSNEYPPSLMDTNNYTISTLNNVSLTNFKVV
jgi:hypothetical protein